VYFIAGRHSGERSLQSYLGIAGELAERRREEEKRRRVQVLEEMEVDDANFNHFLSWFVISLESDVSVC
jgi:hypothetical protein